MNEWMGSIHDRITENDVYELRRIANSLERLANALAPRTPRSSAQKPEE